MSHSIKISTANTTWRAELNDGSTARAICDALPIVGSANLWGEEIYFEIPVDRPLDPNATVDVAVGELGYWPPGRAFCIFFGPTPASSGNEPRAASPVNRIGRVLDDLQPLHNVPDGETVRIEKG